MWLPLFFIEEFDFMCSFFIDELFIDECIEPVGFGEAPLI